MIIDPNVTVAELIAALPSALVILQGYGISAALVADEPLWRALMDCHVDVQQFLGALDQIDWNTEAPSQPK